MKTIEPIDLQKLLTSQPGLPVLDVRTPVEFAEVHVPQARNIPLDSLKPKSLFEAGTLQKNQPVYLLCRSGARATKAAEKFDADGLADTVVVAGGTQAWVAAGLPVTRGKSSVISLERQVRIAAGLLVLTGTLLSLFVHRYFIAVPLFVGTGLTFAGITDWCGMGLLLAKLPWSNKA